MKSGPSREKSVQRPRGMFKKTHWGQCGWGRVSQQIGGEATAPEGRLRALPEHSQAFSFYSQPGGSHGTVLSRLEPQP